MAIHVNVDANTSAWNHYTHELFGENPCTIKTPTDKYNINEVKKWIEDLPDKVRSTRTKIFESTVPESERTDVLLRWLEDHNNEAIEIMSANNYRCTWNSYEHDLYYGFRKYIKERTLKKNEKTVIRLDLNREDYSAILYVTPLFTEENREKATEYFVNQKKATSLTIKLDESGIHQ